MTQDPVNKPFPGQPYAYDKDADFSKGPNADKQWLCPQHYVVDGPRCCSRAKENKVKDE